ncbi:hypothetical protein [Turneriella parva]|uniref:Outer membrane protein beta-barrel domain-containing protein n=1 Tax=Turneriella parva (strain ATCC BAA-1111 / DSM 21527 / NCTC 11395 / H) TaxID=869212 RepID=I4B0T7_TURPD|nr:hypothetical protein [Turneriella parva]AFM10894.1 hypothetical protein Turpa_0234 [Turneriella parva DSM 21527]
MKKLKLIAIMAVLLGAAAPAFSIAQLGVQGNYTSLTFDSSTSSGSVSNKYSGVGFGAFARFTAGIPLLITFGAGPFMDYGTIKGGPATAPESTHLRVGGELVVYADVVGNIIGVVPYGRFGYGYEGNSTKTTIGTVTTDYLYYGSTGHTLFGLTLKVLPLIYVFAEGGIQWSSLTVPSEIKALGVSDVSTTGWRASIGAMLWI